MDFIVIHCSDSPHGRSDGAETIHEWHIENGWDGIGYHYVINEFSQLEFGRPTYWDGAHVRGYNKDSLGICLIGVDFFTESQFATLTRLLRYLVKKHPGVAIKGHYELDDSKTCPNFDVPLWLQERGFDILEVH